VTDGYFLLVFFTISDFLSIKNMVHSGNESLGEVKNHPGIV
jgi:hypothetical protein